MPAIDVAPADEFPPGSVKLVLVGSVTLGVYNVDGELYAIEDRCSHDDGPLAEGDWDLEELVVVCPCHGSRFDLRTGRPLTLPAYVPVNVYPVRVEEGMVKVEVP